MSSNSWGQLLMSVLSDGAAVTNTTTPTSLLPGGSKFVLPSNLWKEDSRPSLYIRASGRGSTAAATPGTLTFDLKFGSTTVWTGGASPTVATSQSNVSWRLEALLSPRGIGSGTNTTLLGTGHLLSAVNTALIQLLPASSPVVGTGFDCAASQQVDLFGTWSVASASNSILLHQFELWLSN
jgi:hypothetical protein